MANKEIWDYLIENGIGCQVQTPYGTGTVVDVDAGAAIWLHQSMRRKSGKHINLIVLT